jgi:hypothetical protein
MADEACVLHMKRENNMQLAICNGQGKPIGNGQFAKISDFRTTCLLANLLLPFDFFAYCLLPIVYCLLFIVVPLRPGSVLQ